jgi:hypothetical protein
MNIFSFLCIAFFCLIAARPVTSKPYLDNSTWTNELNSEMVVVKASNGTFFGTYRSAVGEENGEYRFVGTYAEDDFASILRITMGWSVSWRNAEKQVHATTTWSCKVVDPYTISCTWIETRGLEREQWGATTINKDTFKRKMKQ